MVSAPGQAGTEAGGPRYGPALAAVTVIFFLWGFLTCLNDILVPHLKTVFDLGYARGALVQLAFFSAYLLVSLPAGRVVARVGYQRGLVAGLVLAGAGAVLFYPAASVPSYTFFLSALFVLASGIVFLQVAANAYVAVLGPPEGAPSRLNLTQAFNSLGTTLAPFFGGSLFLARGGTGDHLAEARAVRLPYLGLAVVLFGVAGAVSALRLPRVPAAEGAPGGGSLQAALRVRPLALGVLAIFAYVGAEVSIGSFLVSFLERPDIGGLDPLSAARHVAFYWGGAMAGRFAGALVLRHVDAGRLLAAAATLAGALVLVALTASGTPAMAAVLAVGVCNSIMFPTIFTLGIAGLGHLTSRGSSLLVMAAVGGAVVPVLFGLVADHLGLQRAFVLPALAYLYIAYYGARGSRQIGSCITQ
jgi:FHS family L-fucose permease-like MFS transporter